MVLQQVCVQSLVTLARLNECNRTVSMQMPNSDKKEIPPIKTSSVDTTESLLYYFLSIAVMLSSSSVK